MEDIEKRGLPKYLTAYLNYKLGVVNSIPEELYNEVPNDLKECIDCIAEGKEVPDPSILASYPIYFKEEIIEEVEEHGGSKCATPVASPAAGTYDSTQTVTLTCATDGVTIYYTTDGSEPTSESTEYTGAITVSSDTTIRAIAVKEDFDDSDVMNASYEIGIIYNLTMEEAYDFISKLPMNTPQTAYKINITNSVASDWCIHEDSSSPIEDAVCAGSYVDLSPTTIPSGITDMAYAYHESSKIVKVPAIPNTVTDLNYAFGYSNMLEYPDIPSSVTNLEIAFTGCSTMVTSPVIHTNNTGDPINANGMFWNCTNLTTVTFDGSFYNYYLNFDNTFMFEGCTSLQTINVDSYSDKLTLYNMCHEADSTDSIVTLEKIVCKEECITVDYNHLSSELNLLWGNSPETPYKLNITNTEPSNWSTTEEDGSSDIGYAINHDEPTLYFDLSSTTIPADTTSLQQVFNWSSCIVKSPIIPSTITNLNSAFNYCSRLTEVTINITDFTDVDLSNIFYDCDALENIYVPSASAKTSLINKLVEGTDYPEGMDMSEIIKVIDSGDIQSTR